MLKSLGVKNLRSFRHYAYSELKPITVYLGRNSSGKSSLIRLFPLLKQSVQEITTGPILWYGRYVDYGNFNEAICKNGKKTEGITLTFDLDINVMDYFFLSRHSRELSEIDVSVELNIFEENKKTYTKYISFEIDKAKILIHPRQNNTALITASCGEHEYNIEANTSSIVDFKFFPDLDWINEPSKKTSRNINDDNKNSSRIEYISYDINTRKSLNLRHHNKKTSEHAAKVIQHFFHPNTNLDTISEGIKNINAINKKSAKKEILRTFNSQTFFQNKVKNPNSMDELMDILFPYILLKNYFHLSKIINNSLKNSFLSVKYLAPIRANSERFYRFQDLQVNEMDHTGSNAAMILNAMTAIEKENFEHWTNINFGFIAFVTTDGSHYAIKIKTDNDSEEHNINDMGYGFSQILPIIMSIWLEIKKQEPNNDDEVLFVIEQPELHLHPAYQVRVANLFARVISSIRNKKKNIKFIFETHSQSMIDALGDCIQQRIISKDDINITIFEKNKDVGTTTLKAKFDDEGYLINWPVGFFSGENEC